MDKTFVEGKIGQDGAYALSLHGLKVVAKGSYQAGMFGVSAEMAFGVRELLLLLKEKIPGKIDDALIDFVIAQLDKEQVAVVASEAPAAV